MQSLSPNWTILERASPLGILKKSGSMSSLSPGLREERVEATRRPSRSAKKAQPPSRGGQGVQQHGLELGLGVEDYSYPSDGPVRTRLRVEDGRAVDVGASVRVRGVFAKAETL
jgi:hypothetical protein